MELAVVARWNSHCMGVGACGSELLVCSSSTDAFIFRNGIGFENVLPLCPTGLKLAKSPSGVIPCVSPPLVGGKEGIGLPRHVPRSIGTWIPAAGVDVIYRALGVHLNCWLYVSHYKETTLSKASTSREARARPNEKHHSPQPKKEASVAINNYCQGCHSCASLAYKTKYRLNYASLHYRSTMALRSLSKRSLPNPGVLT